MLIGVEALELAPEPLDADPEPVVDATTVCFTEEVLDTAPVAVEIRTASAMNSATASEMVQMRIWRTRRRRAINRAEAGPGRGWLPAGGEPGKGSAEELLRVMSTSDGRGLC